jgi:hypothetical protein
MSPIDRSSDFFTLSAADAEALDALVNAGLDLAAVPQPLRLRAEAILRVFEVLNLPLPDSIGSVAAVDGLIGSLRARLAHIETEQPTAPERTGGWVKDESGLGEDDIETLEALVNSGYDPKRVPGSLRARAERQAALLSLLTTPVADEAVATAPQRRDTLVMRTLEATQTDVDRQSARMVIEPAARVGRGLRIRDLASIAAVLIIGAAVVMPLLGSMRDGRARTMCASNFAAAGLGFGAYAGDYKDSMPLASASLVGNRWWEVGKNREESNSANLYTLARTSYVTTLEPLACPACDAAPRGKCAASSFDWSCLDEVSYSFQNLFSRSRPNWSMGSGPATQRMVILADRSPITLSSVRNQPQNPFANSPNHKGKGQTVLFNDGSSEWMTDPVQTGGDNIWLPREIELGIQAAEWSARIGKPVLLIGREEPGAPGNVFLGP